MPFFNTNFSLLSSAQQTFVAAIATLVVLCSYKNESNFLSSLTNIFRETIHKDIKRKIENIKKLLKSLDFSFLAECNIFSHSTEVDKEDKERLIKIKLDADVIKNKFLNDVSQDESLKKFDDRIKAKDEGKPFPLLIAFFTFVMCVAVLSIDALTFNNVFATFILFLFDLIFLVLTIAGWCDYWIDNPQSTDNAEGKKRSADNAKSKKRKLMLFVALALILAAFVFKTSVCTKILFFIIAILLSSWYLHYYITARRQNDDFDIRYIAKYEIKWMGIATILALIIYFALCYDVLYQVMPNWIQRHFTVITDNFSLIENNIFAWQRFFIVLCVCNAFILPFLLKFLSDKKNWHSIRANITKKYDDAQKEVKELKEKYTKLKNEILSKDSK